MFRNNLLRKNTVGESGAPSLLQKEKRRSAKSDVSKVLFPDIGKITNPITTFYLKKTVFGISLGSRQIPRLLPRHIYVFQYLPRQKNAEAIEFLGLIKKYFSKNKKKVGFKKKKYFAS